MKWTVVFYEHGRQKPVERFIDSLQAPAKAKLRNQIRLLEEFGSELGMPVAKPLGKGLYELRVRGRQEVRVFYIFAKSNRIYLLHGFLKKTQAIPKKEINIAIARQQQINNL